MSSTKSKNKLKVAILVTDERKRILYLKKEKKDCIKASSNI
jgi:hypothetical protein